MSSADPPPRYSIMIHSFVPWGVGGEPVTNLAKTIVPISEYDDSTSQMNNQVSNLQADMAICIP